MKKIITVLFLLNSFTFGQFWVHDFESSGGYSTSIPEFTDGSKDYFLRTNGNDISSAIYFNNIEGAYYFTAQDIDGEGATLPVSLTFNSVNISSETGLEFGVLLAEDDDGTNQDWDATDYVHFLYSIDGGAWQNLLWIENNGAGTNSAPFIDYDFDGTGEGDEITENFTEYTKSISETGSTIQIKIEFNLNSGDEDIGIDFVRIGTDSNPLPVELTTFTASVVDKNVELNWETATEVNNYGFEIERQYLESSIKLQEWEKISFVEGHGNSNSPKYYSYTDNTLEKSGNYVYRLKQVDIDGTYEYSEEVEIDFGSPEAYELSQNYPNPFNPTTSIKYNLPTDAYVRLNVYNILGETIAELVNTKKSAGYHNVTFNAEGLNSGIYFYKLETNNFTQIHKMLLIK